MIHSPGGNIEISVRTVNGDAPANGSGNQCAVRHTLIERRQRLEKQGMMSHNQAGLSGSRFFQDGLIQLQGYESFPYFRVGITQLQAHRVAGQRQRRRRQLFNKAGYLLNRCQQGHTSLSKLYSPPAKPARAGVH
jgi:hypothetical protein